FFFFSSRRRHTRFSRDWSSDVCSSDLSTKLYIFPLMNREKEILQQKIEASRMGGGQERIDRQHEQGKLTARERIQYLLDPGSFEEFARFVTHRTSDFGMGDRKIVGDGVVTGMGTIDG